MAEIWRICTKCLLKHDVAASLFVKTQLDLVPFTTWFWCFRLIEEYIIQLSTLCWSNLHPLWWWCVVIWKPTADPRLWRKIGSSWLVVGKVVLSMGHDRGWLWWGMVGNGLMNKDWWYMPQRYDGQSWLDSFAKLAARGSDGNSEYLSRRSRKISWRSTVKVIPRYSLGGDYTPPKFNSSPLKNGWLEDDPFLLCFGNFSVANC